MRTVPSDKRVEVQKRRKRSHLQWRKKKGQNCNRGRDKQTFSMWKALKDDYILCFLARPLPFNGHVYECVSMCVCEEYLT